ncbi:MAG: hypothetical protein COT17_06750 [Elusimicrobia bacterium CG08_land_8_20_14_0_20_51_18]|nr:MAG: hypothetical protein COT17_06750 [Elusimicrobia bacterium CG08_land_8_20_14_0_20_51_18]
MAEKNKTAGSRGVTAAGKPEPGVPGGGIYSFLAVAAFFVSPLVFFTDLTRNPYYFQITLLNVSVLACVFMLALKSLKRGGLELPPEILDKAVLFALLVFFLSSLNGYFNHNEFFRPAMLSEFKRIWAFSLINCLFPFFLARFAGFERSEDQTPKYLALLFLWGALWVFFPFAKAEASGESLFFKFWDFYGGLLWAGGIWLAWSAVRKINHDSLLHLIMATGAIASLYGILQYFGVEFIWAKLINPYGRRSVSTFGNPNFISSYALMLIPLSLYYLARSESVLQRFFYYLVFFSSAGMIFASLTRSSMIGLAAAFVFMFSFSVYRNAFSFRTVQAKKIIIGAALILLLWPDQNLKPMSLGVFSRLAEGARGAYSRISLDVKRDEIYPSFHQRLLIWSGAFNMYGENPVLGKGWGNFELFYPYYQGDLLRKYPGIRNLRTHANNSHNEILEILSQTGLLGLGACFLLAAGLFFSAKKYLKAASREDSLFVIACSASLVGMLADNMLNVSLHFAVPGFLFWWIMGVLNRKLSPAPGTRPSAVTGRFASYAVPALAAVFCVVSAWYWQAQFMREVYYFNGFKLMRKNNFPEAAKSLKKAYDFQPAEVNNNYELANAYVKSQEYDKAVWAYKEALGANSGYDEIFFNLAVIEKKTGLTAEAAKNFRTSIWINPTNKQAYQALVELYLPDPAGNADEAVPVLDMAASVFPYDPNMYNYAGYFLTYKGDYSAARERYERGLERVPGDRLLHENLSGVLATMKTGKSAALEFAKKYSEINGLLSSEPSRALAEFSVLEKKHPDNLSALYLKSKIMFTLGRTDEALRLLLSVLEEREDFSEARYGLAVIYEKKNMRGEAKREWGKLLEYEPENRQARERFEKL